MIVMGYSDETNGYRTISWYQVLFKEVIKYINQSQNYLTNLCFPVRFHYPLSL